MAISDGPISEGPISEGPGSVPIPLLVVTAISVQIPHVEDVVVIGGG